MTAVAWTGYVAGEPDAIWPAWRSWIGCTAGLTVELSANRFASPTRFNSGTVPVDRGNTCHPHTGQGRVLTVSQQTAGQSWLPNFLAGLVISTGVGYLAAAYTVSRWLTRPSPRRPEATPQDFGLSWERLECKTADRHRLVG